MKIVPMVLCMNEEIWIERVLSALTKVFEHVIVADTGSTDSTLEQINKVKGVHLMRYEHLSPAEVGQCRGWMQAEAKTRFGATHVFLVDGDELYPVPYLRFLVEHPMPEDSLSGFTYGIECTELENGECWLLGNQKGLIGISRQAIFSVDSQWQGIYPFESPDTFIAGHPKNYYWFHPAFYFYHLHQMKRSSKDQDVHLRMRKKYQFSMQEHPEIVPFQLWLRRAEDYRDE